MFILVASRWEFGSPVTDSAGYVMIGKPVSSREDKVHIFLEVLTNTTGISQILFFA